MRKEFFERESMTFEKLKNIIGSSAVESEWKQHPNGLGWVKTSALNGLLSDESQVGSWEGFAESSYKIADAMMKAREVKP